MSYIIFEESTGLITSVSYKIPNTKTKYITVSDKVGDDFLSGAVSTTEYRVLKSKLSSLYRLVPRDKKPSLGLFDFFVQPFKQKMIGTFYFKQVSPITQNIDKWITSNITSPLYKFRLVKVSFLIFFFINHKLQHNSYTTLYSFYKTEKHKNQHQFP